MDVKIILELIFYDEGTLFFCDEGILFLMPNKGIVLFKIKLHPFFHVV
jgi:hypothetical protein